ncbi:16S rRNA (adenine(1518)-N(6)/adenine(1519)-N(6))-dimethyltransferase RsmA [Leptolyngbya sp. FACHB-17]|uniref:16S rRNA (adenine(1518)-N(6)/adenine(1519)-N(6))- dimethyltransferase RsmA n=1 Tax=unclassified Leptolyngbya TaxID=2650499 RepID=UPI0016802C3D|nr:16S rRNA (adenine(1518)-N(6)/adenine(1519)-N(6))-dimethyltransferase RsmA [Leptolyngbya sp. FACHB-17]
MPKARKQFGQHWLKSEKALNKIVSSAELTENDRVLEIGAGTGILTRQLIAQAQAVVAVEIDRDLCPILVQKFGKFENFLLLQGDFLTLEIDPLLEPFPPFQNPRKVVANIPYNITGPILEKLLGTIAAPNPNPFESIVLLLQKEVALRICANSNSSHYGALSIRVQYLADAEFICDVSAKAFSPPPKVDSAVIRLRPRAIEHPATDPKKLETLIKLGFSSRRKMLRNNLKSVVELEPLNALLQSLEINPQARAEDLSIRQWIDLSNAFSLDKLAHNIP